MSNLAHARAILKALDLPRKQQNDRTAWTLLALLNLEPETPWGEAQSRLIGTTPVMNFIAEKYGQHYKPNSREEIRDNSLQPLVNAGMVLLNPDDPARPKNSRLNVYQIEPSTLELLKTFSTDDWDKSLAVYRETTISLAARYAKERQMSQIPVTLADGQKLSLSTGNHSKLIKLIIEDFASRFVPGGKLVYVGDTASKWGYFDRELHDSLGLVQDSHGKMPDVIFYYPEKNWLLLIESVTSNGPMDGRRHEELAELFKSSTAPIVYITAFPTRKAMGKYLSDLSWETEVWCADAPTHMIHFNGDRFLGPH